MIECYIQDADAMIDVCDATQPSGYNSVSEEDNSMTVSRRKSLKFAAAGIASVFIPKQQPAISATATSPSITIPLEYQPKLSAYTIAYTIGTRKFGAIIDTGSPFLLVPENSETTCRPEYKWGCLNPKESQPAAGLEPTLERFDGNEGRVEWREGKFSFDIAAMNKDRDTLVTESGKINDRSSLLSFGGSATANAATEDEKVSTSAELLFPRSLMTFGVINESLMDGPGGIFLGMVKNTDSWIRPSFLGQSDVSALSVDLRQREGMDKALTLYGPTYDTQQQQQNYIPLVRDLNKRFGDPTVHYVGVASSINANGSNLATSSSRRNKIYCIFDTGCSGMTISQSLYDERYGIARTNREKSLWGTVDIDFKTNTGETITLNAKRPITTPLDDRPWGKKLDGHLIVIGLAFLEGLKTTIDIDGDRIWFED